MLKRLELGTMERPHFWAEKQADAECSGGSQDWQGISASGPEPVSAEPRAWQS